MASPVELIMNNDPFHNSEVSFDAERGLAPPTNPLKSLAILEKVDCFSGALHESSDDERSSSPEIQRTMQHHKTYTCKKHSPREMDECVTESEECRPRVSPWHLDLDQTDQRAHQTLTRPRARNEDSHPVQNHHGCI